ncbi:hypothetical protein Sm713_56100 [Streptomyces sp. TS71-3]|nr:hypothetical protein Sm713_56100 [Streptomyces sp. TS71-3]
MPPGTNPARPAPHDVRRGTGTRTRTTLATCKVCETARHVRHTEDAQDRTRARQNTHKTEARATAPPAGQDRERPTDRTGQHRPGRADRPGRTGRDRDRQAANATRTTRTKGSPLYEGVVQDLIDELGRLPGVGPKSAQRIAFHILQAEPADVRRLAQALLEVKAKVRFCSVCGNVAQEEQCGICRDARRDLAVICVVEEPKDVVAIERTREFRGRYHVLGGAISPIEGVGPDDLRIRELLARLADGTVTELILATDPNLEGEATATYLARMIKPMGLKVTRLASGLPVGGDLEYADEVTLGRAFEGRRLLDV